MTAAVTVGLPSRSAPTQLPNRRNAGTGGAARPLSGPSSTWSIARYTAGTSRNSVSSNAVITVRTSSAGVIPATRSCAVRHSRSTSSCSRRRISACCARAGPLVVDLGEQPAEPAQRRHHRAAARLGRVRGEHRVHPQPGQQVVHVAEALLGGDPRDRVGERLARRAVPGIALPQRAHPLLLFGQVGQVEVDGEGAGDLLGALPGPGGDERRDGVAGGGRLRRRKVGYAAGLDHRAPQPLHVREQVRPVGLGDDLAEDVAEQPDVPPHRLGQLGRVSFPVPHGAHETDSNHRPVNPIIRRSYPFPHDGS